MKKLHYKHKKKILSILAQHLFLFGKGVINYDKETLQKVKGLIDSVENEKLSGKDINKLISIIKQHSLLFGHGIIDNNNHTISGDDNLIRYLKNLMKQSSSYTPGIIPRVNYLNFKRKISSKINIRKFQKEPTTGGFPLFGKKRISADTIKNGYLILFSLPNKQQSKHRELPTENAIFNSATFIHIISITQNGKVKYREEKSIINFDGYIHTIVITKEPYYHNTNNFSKFSKTPIKNGKIETKFKIPVELSDALTIRTKNNSIIYITGNAYYSYIKQQLIANPNKKQFSFFFPNTKNLFTQITQFLTRLIKKASLISNVEADNISYFITKKIFLQNTTPTNL